MSIRREVVGDGLPSSREVADALLKLLGARTVPTIPQEAYITLAEQFRLGSSQLALKRRTTAESLWNNRVQTAREHLAKTGLLRRGMRGKWHLTEKGVEWARCQDRPIGLEVLDL